MKTIAGVALAAVVGACALTGGAQRAEAAIIVAAKDYYVAGIIIPNGYPETTVGAANIYYIPGRLDLSYLTYAVYVENTGEEIDSFRSFSLSSFSVSDPNSLDYYFQATGDGQSVQYVNDRYNNNGGQLGPYFFNSPTGGVRDVLLSVVPLPASAPLFAAAFLALGSVQRLRRRERRPQAA